MLIWVTYFEVANAFLYTLAKWQNGKKKITRICSSLAVKGMQRLYFRGIVELRGYGIGL